MGRIRVSPSFRQREPPPARTVHTCFTALSSCAKDCSASCCVVSSPRGVKPDAMAARFQAPGLARLCLHLQTVGKGCECVTRHCTQCLVVAGRGDREEASGGVGVRFPGSDGGTSQPWAWLFEDTVVSSGYSVGCEGLCGWEILLQASGESPVGLALVGRGAVAARDHCNPKQSPRQDAPCAPSAWLCTHGQRPCPRHSKPLTSRQRPCEALTRDCTGCVCARGLSAPGPLT